MSERGPDVEPPASFKKLLVIYYVGAKYTSDVEFLALNFPGGRKVE